MISEGSCDTEDWSNDAENSALPSEEKFYFKICYLGYTLYIKQKLFQILIIIHKITVLT